MTLIPAAIGPARYDILIESGARRRLPDLLGTNARGVVVTDQAVARLHLPAVLEILPGGTPVICFPPGERSKSLSQLGAIYDQLAAARVERGDVIIALGGGVVGDLAGFAAATWLRGVRFVQMPTTTEAAIDASVGGKTGINIAAGKNLVGAFHQPIGVIIDTDFLDTLAPRDFVAGLAESVKHAAIQDADFLTFQEEHAEEITQRERETLGRLLARNVEIKVQVVAADEREAHQRAMLNHGHTIGHAIEHLMGYELRHGECVALGMIAENALATARGMLSQPDAERIRRLLQRLGLPSKLPRALGTTAILEACRLDKKNRGGAIHFMLLRGVGAVQRVTDVTEGEIAAALATIAAG